MYRHIEHTEAELLICRSPASTCNYFFEVSRTFLSRTFQVIITQIVAVRLIVITDLKLFIEDTIYNPTFYVDRITPVNPVRCPIIHVFQWILRCDKNVLKLETWCFRCNANKPVQLFDSSLNCLLLLETVLQKYIIY